MVSNLLFCIVGGVHIPDTHEPDPSEYQAFDVGYSNQSRDQKSQNLMAVRIVYKIVMSTSFACMFDDNLWKSYLGHGLNYRLL